MSDFEIAHHQDNWTDSARIIPTFTQKGVKLVLLQEVDLVWCWATIGNFSPQYDVNMHLILISLEIEQRLQ